MQTKHARCTQGSVRKDSDGTGRISCPESISSIPEDTSVRLRPHHLLCLQNFRGKGYSPAFVLKMQAVRRKLLESPAPCSVLLVQGADDLCECCPHRRGDHCMSEKPAGFDELVLARTGLCAGDVLTDGIRSARLPVMSEGLLKDCCPGCQWLEICIRICKRQY